MNEDQELKEMDNHVHAVANEMMRAFVAGVSEIDEELFNKYSSHFHVILLSSINFALMDAMAQTATESGTEIMANPDEVFQYMMKEVMEETIKAYFIKRQITKEGAH